MASTTDRSRRRRQRLPPSAAIWLQTIACATDSIVAASNRRLSAEAAFSLSGARVCRRDSRRPRYCSILRGVNVGPTTISALELGLARGGEGGDDANANGIGVSIGDGKAGSSGVGGGSSNNAGNRTNPPLVGRNEKVDNHATADSPGRDRGGEINRRRLESALGDLLGAASGSGGRQRHRRSSPSSSSFPGDGDADDGGWIDPSVGYIVPSEASLIGDGGDGGDGYGEIGAGATPIKKKEAWRGKLPPQMPLPEADGGGGGEGASSSMIPPLLEAGAKILWPLELVGGSDVVAITKDEMERNDSFEEEDEEAPYLDPDSYTASRDWIQPDGSLEPPSSPAGSGDGSIRWNRDKEQDGAYRTLVGSLLESHPDIPPEFLPPQGAVDHADGAFDDEEALLRSLASGSGRSDPPIDPEELHRRVFENEQGYLNQSEAFRRTLSNPNAASDALIERRGKAYRRAQDEALQKFEKEMEGLLRGSDSDARPVLSREEALERVQQRRRTAKDGEDDGWYCAVCGRHLSREETDHARLIYGPGAGGGDGNGIIRKRATCRLCDASRFATKNEAEITMGGGMNIGGGSGSGGRAYDWDGGSAAFSQRPMTRRQRRLGEWGPTPARPADSESRRRREPSPRPKPQPSSFGEGVAQRRMQQQQQQDTRTWAPINNVNPGQTSHEHEGFAADNAAQSRASRLKDLEDQVRREQSRADCAERELAALRSVVRGLENALDAALSSRATSSERGEEVDATMRCGEEIDGGNSGDKVSGGPWVEVTDPDTGEVFYWNEETEEMRWEEVD